MKFQAALVAAVASSVNGHAHLSSPRSRTEIAFQNGQDYCPHCTLEDVGSPPGSGGRPYPGSRPFSEPGMSTLTMGPCGQNGGNNYNAPGGSWGAIEETYESGQVISFESCWQADHKGTYSMRVCPDEALVSRFITPGVTPSSSEMSQLEQCFQDNILPCTGVPGNRGCDALAVGSGCQAGWGCASNTDWFYSPNQGAFDDGSCSTGFYTRDQVQLPQGFTSNHTLLSWRWDALDTAQLYTGCVDVAIAPSGGFPTLPPTEAPPTAAPPAPTPEPGPCVPHYQQCGGINHNGPTECCDGRTCEVINDYYFQCL